MSTTLLGLCLSFLTYPTFLMVNSHPLPVVNEQVGNTTQIQTYVVHVQRPQGTRFLRFGDRKSWYMSFLPNNTLASGERRMLYAYRHVISGFAARLTHEEVEAMESMDGFVTAYIEKIFESQTTYTPYFLGLNGEFGQGFWNQYNFGEGKIIGVIDSGIKPTHPSFNEDGMPPPPAKWNGACYWGAGRLCNNKLLGAIGFRNGNIHTPLDDHGHGTHCASTAAGSFVDNAEVLGYAEGRASGTAPGAHLAIYKVLHKDAAGRATGTSSDIFAGIDKAIRDNVDVLSMSLGSVTLALHESPVAVGSFAAIVRGIFPCAAAANEGPAKSVIGNDAPWILTVGASTTGRKIMASVRLGNGREFPGESTYQPSTLNNTELPLVYPFARLATPDASACNLDLRQFNVQGKIVMCTNTIIDDITRGYIVKRAGGAGMIVMNVWESGDTTAPHSHVLPTTNVGNRVARMIGSYYANTANPTAAIVFKGTQYEVSPSPAVATFSSRGPSLVNGGIIKPDVIAPGVNILAAWPWDISPTPTGKAATFYFESGTSMATPHVSGIAALLQKAYPNWSPAAIKSALMTTAYILDRDGKLITDEFDDSTNRPATVYARGSGHVDPLAAINPGLIYNLYFYNYVHYLCGAGYLDWQVTAIVAVSVQCANVQKVPPENLNYPSFIAYLGSSSPSVTVRRTVTNVGEPNSVYTIGGDEPDGVNVDVNPTTLQFSQLYEKLTFEVTFSLKGAPLQAGQVSEGQLYWDSGKFLVRSPIAITFV